MRINNPDKIKTVETSYKSGSSTAYGGANPVGAQLDYLKDKTEKLEDKIENSKLSIIETLGLFIALFTFVSVDFQVFKSYRSPVAIGALTAILIGAIFLFIVVFDYFILQARKIRKTEENTDSKKYLEDKRASLIRRVVFCTSLLLIFSGIFIFSKTTP